MPLHCRKTDTYDEKWISYANPYISAKELTICLSAHRKYPLGSRDAETRNKSVDILHKTLEFADYIRLINDDLAAGKGNIVAVHLKETLPGIYRGLRFGEGIVPFKELISTLCRSGIFKYTAEFWYKEDLDYVREINEANIFFRDIFERI